ncbi:MAG: SMI1/KNR4 family protein [Chlamydiota bacterium]|jgi:hypothetical protein
MNSHAKRFYQQTNEETDFEHFFYEVIYLEEKSSLSFSSLKEMSPNLPKGWFELSKLTCSDRIEFTRDYWLKTLPFHPRAHPFLENFFSNVEDIGIYLTKENPKSAFEPELVYSMQNDSCFFRGFPPASYDLLQETKAHFHNRIPNDFLSFNLIHNGFKKHSDTGIIPLEKIRKVTDLLHQSLLESDREVLCNEKAIDPSSLFPFYECFGLQSFQCFYADWYPTDEMGNVYFSGIDYSISDPAKKEKSLAFSTFLDWLIFYLEQIEM